MKRVLFSTIALFALLLGSCEQVTNNDNSDNGGQTPVVGDEFHIVSDPVVTFLAAGGNAEIEYAIDIEIDGAELTAVSDEEWITNITVGDTVTFTVEENETIADRLGYVTLQYANTSKVITIDQWGRLINYDAVLKVTSERSLSFGAEGGNGVITYVLSGANEGDKPLAIGNQEWIKDIVVDSEEIRFVVEENNTSSSRRGNIAVSYGSYNFTVTIKQEEPSGIVILSAESSCIKLGNSINFIVTFSNTDVTALSTIYDFYTKAKVSNPFTPSKLEQFVFYAKYNGLTSAPFAIDVVPSDTPDLPADSNPESYDFNQRMLIVDHTGSGCPNCPAVKEVFKAAEENANYKDRFNPVFSYSYSSSELCYSQAAQILWNYYKEICKTGDQLTGKPSFTVNYCYDWTGKFNLEKRIDDLWVENTTASIALSNKRDGNKLLVNAAVKSSKSQSIKLSLWMLEDGVYETQSGATASWMHTHHNVLRSAITEISASDIAGMDFGFVTENTTYERVISFDLSVASSWNINNCKLIAIISAPNSDYDGRYEVVNTAICDFNSSIGFDYKK